MLSPLQTVPFASDHSLIRSPALWVFALGICGILIVAGQIHYLLFHTLAEVFAVGVSFSIFGLAWASQQTLRNGYLVVLGAAYGTIGMVDIFHALTYDGMGLIPGVSTNEPSQLWLVARFLEALALIVAPLQAGKSPRFYVVATGVGALGLGAMTLILVFKQVLPDTHVPGVGLTSFKIACEYLIISLFVLAGGMLWRVRARFPADVFQLLMVSLVLAVAQEFCFTQYVGFYDFANELGHFLRFFSVGAAYLALVVTGIQRPADMLYRQLAESEEHFHTIADYTYDWEYWIGEGDELLYVSPSCERITGYSAQQFMDDPSLMTRIVHPDDRAVYEAHKQEQVTLPHGQLSFRIIHQSGQVRWIAHGCQRVYSASGKPLGRRASNRDITDLKQAEQQAYELAYFDSLTNLPNRRLLMDRLALAVGQAQRQQRALAVMFLDLDNFKGVNDSLGHHAGDRLLIEVGLRLTACVRKIDTVSRSGGDEFIVVLPEITQPDDAATVAQKILSAFAEPVWLDGQPWDVTTSIGIAVLEPGQLDDAPSLMRKADQAMYDAKHAGKGVYRYWRDGA